MQHCELFATDADATVTDLRLVNISKQYHCTSQKKVCVSLKFVANRDLPTRRPRHAKVPYIFGVRSPFWCTCTRPAIVSEEIELITTALCSSPPLPSSTLGCARSFDTPNSTLELVHVNPPRQSRRNPTPVGSEPAHQNHPCEIRHGEQTMVRTS